MHDEEDRAGHDPYGPWAQIAGYGFALTLMILMFTLASGSL